MLLFLVSGYQDYCRLTKQGREYAGVVSVTKSGKSCQRWDVDGPHNRSDDGKNAANFPEATLQEAANYCRNPDDETAPWCYTLDPNVRWESCDIPMCSK